MKKSPEQISKDRWAVVEVHFWVIAAIALFVFYVHLLQPPYTVTRVVGLVVLWLMSLLGLFLASLLLWAIKDGIDGYKRWIKRMWGDDYWA